MDSSTDIIGLTEQLLRLIRFHQSNGYTAAFEIESERDSVMRSFPTIAEALLARDEGLKVAREALNRLGVGKSPDCMWCDRDEDIATKALARMNDLVPPSSND